MTFQYKRLLPFELKSNLLQDRDGKPRVSKGDSDPASFPPLDMSNLKDSRAAEGNIVNVTKGRDHEDTNFKSADFSVWHLIDGSTAFGPGLW
jgi:hypothetical protein